MKRVAAFLFTTAMVLPACGPNSGRRPPDGLGDMMGGQVKMDDPNADLDGDGFTPNQGDCNDHDNAIYPGAPELCDGKDHNCNKIVDDICDDDKDGYAVVANGSLPGGDCNDQDPLINPGALEIIGNKVDDNCNGLTDEVTPCDNEKLSENDGRGFAASLEMCDPWVKMATINSDADKRARHIKKKYGSYTPKQGGTFAVLSTGLAVDETESGFVIPQPGTEFVNDDPNPAPMVNKNACYSGADEMTVHDYVELKVTLKVPTNAKSFTFNFNFMSAEYPEFVGTEFNDKFLVLLDSKAFKGNISFDNKMNPITVNAGFFDVCDSAMVCNGSMVNKCSQPVSQLSGTGMELDDGSGEKVGGGTGWLKTTAPVKPGETATLRFIIFDEGDHIYDSVVLIDNFLWQADASSGPMTIQ